MDDWEVLKSAEAIFQTYDAAGGMTRHRTALVLRQDPARPIEVDGRRPRYGLFLVEVATRGRPRNSVVLRAHSELDTAIDEAVAWLGERRAVTADKVPVTALIGVANVIRDPSLLARYAPAT